MPNVSVLDEASSLRAWAVAAEYRCHPPLSCRAGANTGHAMHRAGWGGFGNRDTLFRVHLRFMPGRSNTRYMIRTWVRVEECGTRYVSYQLSVKNYRYFFRHSWLFLGAWYRAVDYVTSCSASSMIMYGGTVGGRRT